MPRVTFKTQHDERNDVDVAVVFIKFGSSISGSNPDHDEVVLRLLNPNKSRRKMLTLRFRRRNGQISIQDSTVTSSFFFENNRDRTEASSDRIDIMKSMESDYVGFWIMYRYRNVSIGSQLRLSPEDMKFTKASVSRCVNISYKC